MTKKTQKLQAATIGKLARDAAAPVLAGTNARVSGDAIDATLSCADEFVRLVYAEGKKRERKERLSPPIFLQILRIGKKKNSPLSPPLFSNPKPKKRIKKALEASDAAKKSTVLPDHVVEAITNLGFDESILQIVRDAAAAAKADAQSAREAAAASRAAGGGGGFGGGGVQMTEEEAIAMQQRLFAEARARTSSLVAGEAAAAAPPGEDEKKE